MKLSNIKKSKHFVVFTFFLLLCLTIDQIFFRVATLNNQFVFGLLGTNIVAILISVLSLALIYYLDSRLRGNDRAVGGQYFAFSLLSAGVISNTIERIIYGGVVDYINILFIPTFNFADIVIIFALVLMAWQKIFVVRDT